MRNMQKQLSILRTKYLESQRNEKTILYFHLQMSKPNISTYFTIMVNLYSFIKNGVHIKFMLMRIFVFLIRSRVHSIKSVWV